MAKNQIGITTGSLASALKHMLFVSCIPITFSHTKYNGVQAKPNVMNCTVNNFAFSFSVNKLLQQGQIRKANKCELELNLVNEH